MSDFEIIKGYGVPPRRWSKYPFHQLDVGDAFTVDLGSYGPVKSLASRLNAKGNIRVTVRKRDADSYVVVRVA